MFALVAGKYLNLLNLVDEIPVEAPSTEMHLDKMIWYASAPGCWDERLTNWTCTACLLANQHAQLYAVLKNDEFNTQVPFVSVPEPGSLVHSGFLNAMESLAPQFMGALKQLHSSEYRNYKVGVTGHSLGGAMASLAAIKIRDIFHMPWSHIQLYTFGQPRTGNRIFARWFDAQPLTVARVVNYNDFVPHVLGAFINDFAHHQNEVYIDRLTGSPKLRICNTRVLEDPTCSNSVPTSALLAAVVRAQWSVAGILAMVNSNLNRLDEPVNVNPTVTKMLVAGRHDIQAHTAFAAAAYCPTIYLKDWDCSFCKASPGIKFVSELINSTAQTAGYVALDSVNERVLISYRGTNNRANRLANLKIFTVPFLAVPQTGAFVHAGFLESTMSLMPHTLKVLRELPAIQVKGELGLPWSQIHVFTYGQPRTGNRNFAQWYNRQPVTMARVVNSNDIIPHLLGGSLGYFSHHQTEIFLQTLRNRIHLRVCDRSTLEDPTCSNGIPTSEYSIEAHMNYFGVEFEAPC
ncbi:hypothetical protein L0F63_005269 [Massospora cicadina]|nr:hypothetical protein L0F63_005269 [Massospora cicadina]